MTSRTFALCGLLVLSVLAGCGGLTDAPGTATPGTATPGTATPGTATPGTATATPNTTAPGTPVHNASLPGDEVLNTHAAGLNDSGSFVYRQNTTVTLLGRDGGLINYKNVTALTNLSVDRILSRERVALQPFRETYVDGNGTAYQRQRNATNTAYAVYDDQVADTSTYVRPPLDGYFGGLNFSAAGTTTVEGTTVDVYRVTSTDQLDPANHSVSGFAPSNYESLNVSVGIDRDGTFRWFDYHAVSANSQGDRLRFDLSIRYSAVGSTTVPEPDWLDEARQNE